MPVQVQRSDLIHPELSYQLVGCAYDVFNELGFGHEEKHYQKAFAIVLDSKKIQYKEQVYTPLKFQDKVVGRQYFDFLIEDKVIVELKKDARFAKQHMDQVNNYLKVSELQLAILINFSKDGVIYKRILNVR